MGPHSVLLKLSQGSHSVSAEQNKVQCGVHGGEQRAESSEQRAVSGSEKFGSR